MGEGEAEGYCEIITVWVSFKGVRGGRVLGNRYSVYCREGVGNGGLMSVATRMDVIPYILYDYFL